MTRGRAATCVDVRARWQLITHAHTHPRIPDLAPTPAQDPKGLQDLEEYDPTLSNQLREHVLELDITPSLADQLALDFDGLVPGGGAWGPPHDRKRRVPHSDDPWSPTDATLVTNENKHEYAQLKAREALVGDRRAALDAIRRGFRDVGFADAVRARPSAGSGGLVGMSKLPLTREGVWRAAAALQRGRSPHANVRVVCDVARPCAAERGR